MLSKEFATTSVRIPEIGLGTWHYHAGPEPLRKGLDAGALFIDTAESYDTESVVAEAVSERRDKVFLATKVSPGNFRRADVLKAADMSLQRLRTDHIDLYQLHKPNESIPIEETIGAMEELVDAGKIRFIGVSNFSLTQLQEAQRVMRKYRISSNQLRYNLVDRTIQGPLLSYCQANKITVIAYSPLAREFQRIHDGDPKGVLSKVAADTGRTEAQVALNWCVSQQDVVAIPKGNSEAHILENCGASGWRLSPEHSRELDQAVLFRRRTPLEMVLRKCIPGSLHGVLKRLVKLSPPALRRRVT